jgi:DNA-3-methyladenine glycosylase II
VVSSTTIAVRPPYRLDLTATALRRLSTNVVDVFGEDRRYRRAFVDAHGRSLITVLQTTATELVVDCEGDAQIDPLAIARRMLGVDVDLEPFYTASAAFPWLHALVVQMRGVKPPRYPTLWEAIVNAVVFQQVSIHAAVAILRRVIERYETPTLLGEARLHPFPEPHIIADADAEELRALGLSINKVVALRGLARALIDGEIAESDLIPLSTPAVIERLVTHRGIGPWTAAVIALRGLGRLDIFPEKDSGVAVSLKALSGAADVDAGAILTTLGNQRGMLYYHLLLGRLAARGEIAP